MDRDSILNKMRNSKEQRYKNPPQGLSRSRGLNPNFDERFNELENLKEDRPWFDNGLPRYKRVPEIAFIQEQPTIPRNYDMYRNMLIPERLGLGGSTVHLTSHVEPFDNNGLVKKQQEMKQQQEQEEIQFRENYGDISINLIDSVINEATIKAYYNKTRLPKQTINSDKNKQISIDLKYLKESNWFFPVLVVIFCIFLYIINSKLNRINSSKVRRNF